MKIIVCVKQVPDTLGDVVINPDGTLNRASMKAITNPDDLYAVEKALQLKDRHHCQVTVLSMGPPSAEAMLRELLAMGCDEAVLISGREFGGSDTLGTSQILAAGISTYRLEKDTIILCGRQAIDGDTAQVGPQVAERLSIPQLTCVTSLQLEGKQLICTQKTDLGVVKAAVQLPCLLTVVQNPDVPRYMNAWDIMRAFQKPLQVYDYSTLKDHPLLRQDCIGLRGASTTIYKSFAPRPKEKRLEILSGDRVGCQAWIRRMKEQQKG